MKHALVAGATGYLGKYIVREFKRQGYWIRALARNENKFNDLNENIDEKFVGEITDSNSLSGICKDIDIVFSSIGITKQKDGLTYMDVDYQGNVNLLEEARKENVQKFIYVSVFNAENMKNLKGIAAKVKFEEELKKSGTNYSIIYPNGFFSDMLEYMQMAKKGKGYVFGSGENKINPIHGEDLAEVCVNASKGDEKEIKIGGPDM
ncbi:MAG: SDR family oxidoreductase, partial [Ignavibacteriaceae bacterium]|nr:SDR family oxidoreductase [Ignavibacteriaceae bacterium]